MAKKVRAVFFLFMLIFVFRVNAQADSGEIKGVTLTVDGEEQRFNTYADTVSEFLDEMEIELKEKDIINVDLDDRLNEYENNLIEIRYGFYVKVVIDDGEPERYYVSPDERAGHVIAEIKNSTGVDYTYDGYMNDRLFESDVIFLRSAVVKEFTTAVRIPYEKELQFSEDLLPGVEILVQEGRYGEMTTVTQVTYEGDIEVARHVASVLVTAEPVNQIVLVGEAAEGEEPEKIFKGFAYKYMVEMEASAYSPEQVGMSQITALGGKVGYGVVAVDPDVIPLGSWVYIDGYGKALASDTGSSIEGSKIDLCFNTVDECLEFGRRDIDVYVLE